MNLKTNFWCHTYYIGNSQSYLCRTSFSNSYRKHQRYQNIGNLWHIGTPFLCVRNKFSKNNKR